MSAEAPESVDDMLAEMAHNMESLVRENETLTQLFKADPQLMECVNVIKNMGREIEALRERNAGLMEEKNAAIRDAKAWKKKAEAK